MSFNVQRTLVLPYPTQRVSTVTSALALQANNLYNTSIFIIRNVVSSYEYNLVRKTWAQKSSLHTHQQASISAFNSAVLVLNEKRLKSGSESKQVSVLEALSTNIFSTILDPTTLDYVCRAWTTATGDTVYTRLPGVMAQQVRCRVIDAFKGYFKAIESYNANPSAFSGRPRMPGYRNKGAQFVLEFPLAQLNKQGVLPSLAGKRVPIDYAETAYLSDKELEDLQELDLRKEIDAAAKKRGWANATPVHLRIVPSRGRQKIEVVVNCAIDYPVGSFLDNVRTVHPGVVDEMSSKQKEGWLKKQMAELPFGLLPRLAGMDFGLNNVVALGYSTGHKADVVAGKLLEKTLDRCYARIAAFQAEHSTPRMQELQTLKNEARAKNTAFSTALAIELNGLLRSMYSQPRYARLQAELQNCVLNALHQLSSSVIDLLQQKKIDVLVVGLNKGWKTASTLSKDSRTRFGRIAHSRLLALLRYKAEAAGIAVLTTEESYTSQASFVENEKFESKEKKAKTSNQAAVPSTLLKRNHRSETNRNWFHNVSRSDRWSRVHADVNGAFNILRKVFKHFCYTEKLTLKFNCWQLSPVHKLLLL